MESRRSKKLILNASSSSVDEIARIDAGLIESVRVEGDLAPDVAAALDDLLHRDPDIVVVVVVEVAASGDSSNILLDAIGHLKGIRKLRLLATGARLLPDITGLTPTTSLETFELSGNYVKTISLDPLRANAGLRSLELQHGLVTSAQLSFTNAQSQLERLRIGKADLSRLVPNPRLRQLIVGTGLDASDALADTFPHLEEFELTIARGVGSFDFLRRLELLRSLSISRTTKLVEVPHIAHPERLVRLVLLECRRFDDIDGILRLSSLETLAVTGRSLSFSEVSRFTSLRALNRVHVDLSSAQETRDFEELARRSNWRSDLL